MSGLYAITTALIQRLKRNAWDRHFSNDTWDDGQLHSTGLQPFVDELLAGLADTGATQMAGTWDIVAPKNAPAINIIVENINDGITVTNNTTNETINVTEVIDQMVNGFSGSVTVVTGVSGSGSVSVSGCSGTVSISLVLTKQQLNFSNGLLVSVG